MTSTPVIDLKRRTAFTGKAEHYDRVRPGYPAQLFEQIDDIIGRAPDRTALEIGIGTGQATRHLLDRGMRVTGLDIAPDMLTLAAQNLSGLACTFVNSSFEDFDAETARFDVICAAQSFHWVDPERGYDKAARLLKKSGALILIWNSKKQTESKHKETLQEIYRRHAPSISAKPEERMSGVTLALQNVRNALGEHGKIFPTVEEISSDWAHVYSATDYIDLLDSYSDHITLAEPEKTALYNGIKSWIDSIGGSLSVSYETSALVAKPI